MHRALLCAILIFRCLLAQIAAQDHSLRVCVVQPTEHYYWNLIKGTIAWQLAPEIAKLKLRDGTPITAIAVTGKTRDEADGTAVRQRCPYVVELWLHRGADHNELSGIPGAPSPRIEFAQ